MEKLRSRDLVLLTSVANVKSLQVWFGFYFSILSTKEAISWRELKRILLYFRVERYIQSGLDSSNQYVRKNDPFILPWEIFLLWVDVLDNVPETVVVYGLDFPVISITGGCEIKILLLGSRVSQLYWVLKCHNTTNLCLVHTPKGPYMKWLLTRKETEVLPHWVVSHWWIGRSKFNWTPC